MRDKSSYIKGLRRFDRRKKIGPIFYTDGSEQYTTQCHQGFSEVIAEYPQLTVEQPALDSAIKAVELLHKMFNGEEIPKVGDTITEEGALRSPAQVIENEFATSGATMILQSPLVPQECPVDDARLYENRIG